MNNFIEDLISDHQQELQDLRANLTVYFQLCAENSKLKQHRRRPAYALRLPHGDYVFVAKPALTKSHGNFSLTDGIQIESLRTLDHRHSTSVLNLSIQPDTIRKTSWMRDPQLTSDAAENFIELTKFFLLFPNQVFARSKDRCCCCGRLLTDEISRCRGIGPECLRIANQHWQQWLTPPKEQMQPVPMWQSVFGEQ